MKKRLTSIWQKIHLWVGLSVGLFFTLACISGTILVFEEELMPVIYSEQYTVVRSGQVKTFLSIDSLVNRAQRYAAPLKIKKITIPDNYEEDGTLQFTTEGERLERQYLALNPKNGQLVSTISGQQNIFSVAEEFHRKLLMGPTGKLITGILLIGYLLILITGMVLWWPKNKKMLSQRLKIKWDASKKRLNWDIHAVGGMYTLPLLLLICITAMTWSFKWFNTGIYLLFDGKAKEEYSMEAPLASAEQVTHIYAHIYQQCRSASKTSEEGIDISLSDGKEPIQVEIGKDELYFDPHSGNLIATQSFKHASRGEQVRAWMEPLHTGSRFGVVGKALYFFVALFGASLPITGLYVWLGRKKKSNKRTGKPSVRIKNIAHSD